jgi:hypothetical protein
MFNDAADALEQLCFFVFWGVGARERIHGPGYAVAVAEKREVFAQASGVTWLTCQVVIEGSRVSTSRR